MIRKAIRPRFRRYSNRLKSAWLQDCGVCEPECPVDAIKPDTEPGLEKWLEINAKYAQVWPNITIKREPPPDAKDWEGKPDKAELFSPTPGSAALAGLVVLADNQEFLARCTIVARPRAARGRRPPPRG